MKKIILLVLFSALFFTVYTSADINKKYENTKSLIEDFKYRISDGEVIIKKYKGNKNAVIIPDTIENCPVTGICSDLLSETVVTEITFPKTIKEVTGILGADSLRIINLPATVESFNTKGIDYCSNIETINTTRGVAFISIDGVLYSSDGKTL